MNDLKSLLHRLVENEVEFVLIGGYAVIAHGSSLMTRDVDIACRMSLENLQKLWDAVKDLRPVHRQTPQRIPWKFDSFAPAVLKNLYLTTDLGQLDCLGEVMGIGDFTSTFVESEILDLGDFSIRILTMDALIKSKKITGRPRDLHAVYELEAIRDLRKK